MASFVQTFGEKLTSKSGTVDTAAALDGKTVGIYFSAHWCPPCRGFTPKLAEYYTKDLKQKGLEIVFVSSDKDEGAFKEYYNDMPWLALPFEDRDAKAKLSKKFKVSGIPSFIILGSDGATITTDGRSKITSDPTGEEFPWSPKPFAEVIGDTFLKGASTVGKEAIAGKTLGIYFSAHWCPPCRGFTPQLCKLYKECKDMGHPFEIIFSTGDRDEESFKSYYEEMASAGGDWLAVPYLDTKRREDLDALFEVQGIPTFVMVDENGTVINKNARGAVAEGASKFPWAPPLVGSLSNPEGIDESPAICIFAEALPKAQQEAVIKQLEPISDKYVQKGKAAGEDPEFLFFVAKSSDGPVPRIREMCKLGAAPSLDNSVVPTKGETSPVGLVRSVSNETAPAMGKMLLLDIPDEGGYYISDAVEITTEGVEDFISQYQGKKLERQQLEG